MVEQVKIHSDLDIYILLKNGGELVSEFEKFGKTYIWNLAFSETIFSRVRNRLLNKVGIKRVTRREKNQENIFKAIDEADIIFNNTVTNASLLKQLPLNGKRVFSYFHEMQVITDILSSVEEVGYLNNISEKIFVPSMAVKNFFIKDYNIGEEKFAGLKYVIPKPHDRKNIECGADMNIKRIGGNKFLVGCCGTLHWRKGYEFLPLIAKKIIHDKKITDIHFVWIGANAQSIEYSILRNDLVKLGLENDFTFIEPIRDIQPYLSQLDVLALPSREDAFPLVVLEAAYHEIPCIYFSGAGGIPEFSENDAGIAIDYLDVESMADAIIQLKTDDQLRSSLGKRARQKILSYSNDKLIVEELLSHFNNSLS
ncbi:MAG: glycosyltransferase family 4 protein [Daejeonella sp.]